MLDSEIDFKFYLVPQQKKYFSFICLHPLYFVLGWFGSGLINLTLERSIFAVAVERAVTVCAPFTNIQVFPFSPSFIFFWNHEKLRDARTLLGQFFDNPGIITHLGSQIDNSISLSKHVDWSMAFWGKITFLYPGCWGQTVREIRWKYSGNEKSEQPGYFSLDFRPQSRINLSDRISANPSYLSDCFQTWICNDQPVKRTLF